MVVVRFDMATVRGRSGWCASSDAPRRAQCSAGSNETPLGRWSFRRPADSLEEGGGVDDADVRPPGDGRVDGVEHDGAGISTRSVSDDRDVGPVSPDAQLIDGRRAERIGRREDDRPTLPDVTGRELADGRRL